MATAGYKSTDRLQAGPMAREIAAESTALNASARQIVEHIQHHQTLSFEQLSRWMRSEYAISEAEASHDIQAFAASAVDQGFLSVLPPQQRWTRLVSIIGSLPVMLRSLLVGSKLWSDVPRKRHSNPRFTSFLAVILATAAPYVAAPAAVLAVLGTWFVMAEEVFTTFRSVFLLVLFFGAMFCTGVLSHLTHEGAHYLFAKQRGSKVLTVYRGGGSVGMTRHTTNASSEIAITLVGPLAGIATAVSCAVVLVLLLDTSAWPVSLSRLEYVAAILLGLVPAVGQLGNFFPGTADGNILLNSTMAMVKGQT